MDGSPQGFVSIFRCLSWIPHILEGICGQRRCIVPSTTVGLPDEINFYLPNDIIANILSRLPAEVVFNCTRGCKPLMALTTTRSFTDMHMSRATPVITFHNYDMNIEYSYRGVNVKHYFFDEVTQKITTKAIKIDLGPPQRKHKWIDLGPRQRKQTCVAYVYGSYNGFLLIKNLWHDCVLVIWNPITQEQVTVIAPSTRYQVCGFFLHKASKEYRVLFVSKEDACFHYFILGLSTKFTKRIGSFSHPPSNLRNPVLLNNVLHWTVCDELYKQVHGVGPNCSDAIILFDINSEILSTMPHPGGECLGKNELRKKHLAIILMELRGLLCVSDHSSYYEIVVWVYEEKIWVRKHVIFDPILEFDYFDCYRYFDMKVKVLHIFEDEALLLVVSKFLYLYNMKTGVFRRVRRSCVDHYLLVTDDSQIMDPRVSAVCHFNTLASTHADKFVHFSPGEFLCK